jgi:hypothetical protein
MIKLVSSVIGVAFVASFLAIPAQSATRYHPVRAHGPRIALAGDLRGGSGGFFTGPFRQGTPMDHDPIWRRGYYQGNDPDQFVRLQIMRDPRNYAH